MAKRSVIVVVWVLLSAMLAEKTVAGAPEEQLVEVTASDGLPLAGHFYSLPADAIPQEGAPAVLLLHGHTGSYLDWTGLVEVLMQRGYHVLSVEERGMGKTGGESDWIAAVGDVQIWLDWLKAQPGVRPDAIAVGGSRTGAHLAISGCSHDPTCFAVFALSPGCVRSTATKCLDGYKIVPGLYEITEMTAGVVSNTAAPPLFIAVSQGNPGFADSVKTLTTLSEGELSVWFYSGAYDSVSQLLSGQDRLVNRIIDWLDAHLPDKS
jgi:pimeloyl-ACP methyl ester carboxylesterase